jgi:DNA-binding transcriptional ArsR family regulator
MDDHWRVDAYVSIRYPIAVLEPVLKALAEPRRREILTVLSNVPELTAGEIAARFAITRPGVSQHLAVLWEAGLVSVRKQGVRRYYRLRPEGLEDLRDFLSQFWMDHLTRLARAAEAEERRSGTREGNADA